MTTSTEAHMDPSVAIADFSAPGLLDHAPLIEIKPADLPQALYDPPTPRIAYTSQDIEALNNRAGAYAEAILSMFTVDGHLEGNEWVARNPRRDDRNPGSFKFNPRTRGWADFASCQTDPTHKGHGFVSYVAFYQNISLQEAAAAIERALTSLAAEGNIAPTPVETVDAEGMTYSPTVNMPSTFNLRHGTLGDPSCAYHYFTEHGLHAMTVARWTLPDGPKEIRPLTHWTDRDGQSHWCWKQMPGERPLYNLPELIQRPSAPVLIVEGEKAADAAKALAPDHVVMTWSGGAQASPKTDWSPLKDKVVVIWPDNDEPGSNAAASIHATLKAHTAKVRILDQTEIAQKRKKIVERSGPASSTARHSALPQGYDAADAKEEGWTTKDLSEVIHAAPMPYGFCIEHDLIGFVTVKKDEEPEFHPICGRMEVLAKVRDKDNSAWGRLLHWEDGEHNDHLYCLPMQLLSNTTGELAGRFLSGGLYVHPEPYALRKLSEFLQKSEPTRLARCVDKSGWHGPAYVLADKHGTVIQPDGAPEDIILSTLANNTGATPIGSLEGWRQEVAGPCLNNSRLAFAISAEFAGPCMYLLGAESGGFHLVGGSSTGKTTALRVAATVFGNGVESWRTTDNALEAIAAKHNDATLKLDEINECQPDKVGAVAYMLANGCGKNRMNKDLKQKAPQTWRLIFLSTGEIRLADHMKSVGHDTRAGQELRVCDIPADAGVGLGCFEALHGEATGHAFAVRLKEACARHSGTAGPEFVRSIINDKEKTMAFIVDFKSLFMSSALVGPVDGQVHRVADRFALIAAAGELASALGITGWERREAMAAVTTCFNAWLANRQAGTGAAEEAQILDRIRTELVAHGGARFEPLRSTIRSEYSALDKQAHNRLGWWRNATDNTMEYLIPTEAWRTIFTGLDSRLATKVLKNKGYLLPDGSGKSQQSLQIPNMGTKMRVYVLSSRILDDVT